MSIVVPEAIQKLDDAWVALVEGYRATEAARGALLSNAQAVVARDVSGIAYMPLHDIFEETVSRLARVVAESAQRAIASDGLTVSIEATDYTEGSRCSVESVRERWRQGSITYEDATAAWATLWADWRPSLMWAQIIADYPAQRVRGEALAKAADRLVACFDLERHPDARMVGGKVELQMSYMGDRDRPGRLDYSARERLNGLSEAFGVFAREVYGERRPDLLHALAPLRRIEGFASRQRFDLAGGVHVVAFAHTWKFYLPEQIAADLNGFLSEHSAILRRKAERAAAQHAA